LGLVLSKFWMYNSEIIDVHSPSSIFPLLVPACMTCVVINLDIIQIKCLYECFVCANALFV
jgi:hypothetical protein